MPQIHNPLVTPTILSTTTGIDLTSSIATALYTNTTSRKTVVTNTVVHVTAATSYTVAAQVSIGQNATTYNDIIPATTLTALATDKADEIISTNPFVIVPTSTAIKLNVSTAATATTATAEVILIGFLI